MFVRGHPFLVTCIDAPIEFNNGVIIRLGAQDGVRGFDWSKRDERREIRAHSMH